MIKQLNLLYRKLMFYFSKKDIDAILKYDPLNILQENEVNND
mgnify:FL=1|tara:strand:- start:729 stop:854 length:126 start_codon:yes stop_codon:yes gene_type:complete